MKNTKPSIAIYSLLLIVFLLGIYGCPDNSQPKITLKATACLKGNITIEHDTEVRSIPGEQWNLKSTITVKCNGKPVPNAEIKVEFWWPGGEFKRTTGPTGTTTVSKKGHGAPPKGQKFTVTIIGSDGEKEVELETPKD